MTTPYLKFDHIDKVFRRGTQETEVLREITLDIDQGQYVSILSLIHI